MNYAEFVKRKRIRVDDYGFTPKSLNSNLRDWQAKIVDWAVRRGRSALFADTGLGKTLMELAWAEQVVKAGHGPILILCPLGVRQQTVREAEKFGIGVDCKVVDSQADCINGINVTNYDKLQHFEPEKFCGVVLGESSILKSMTGKTRTKLTEAFGKHRFRLCETATPSPNDHMELGNHAEFLGVMAAVDMLNRFFYHDSGNTSQWRLMPHGHQHFWDWVASWAVCIGMPSDIGGDDTGYILPPLKVNRHVIEPKHLAAPAGMLFATAGVAATSIFDEKRQTAEDRIAKAVELVPQDDACIIWCDTNDESKRLADSLPDAVEVRGSDPTEKKEAALSGFSTGQFKTLISKPSICGHGLNWQHCRTMIFAGLTYSFESYYQAVRRCWRFGQTKPVDVHIVIASTDTALEQSISRKQSDFDTMRHGMAEAMRRSTMIEFGLDRRKQEYQPRKKVKVPQWL